MEKNKWSLNNRGWGLRIMLFCVSIFVICLLMIAILISKLGKQMETSLNSNNTNNNSNISEPSKNNNTNNNNNNSTKKEEYLELEELMESVTKDYISDMYNNEFDGKLTINLKQLKEYDTSSKIDYKLENLDCIGYSNVISENDNISISPYLKCTKYTTEGFDSKYLK